jgi:hypothetical protein
MHTDAHMTWPAGESWDFADDFPEAHSLNDPCTGLLPFGDYYRDPADNVTRGLTICSGDDDYTGFFGQVDENCELFSKAKEWPASSSYDSKVLDADQCSEVENELRLLAAEIASGERPPAIPQDKHFKLGNNTILVDSAAAEHLGDALLGFFDADVATVLLKVRRRKFSIKTKITIDGLDCVAKVYLYTQGSSQYVVDVQRRSGDHLVFQRFYRWLSQHLREGCLENDHDYTSALPSSCSREIASVFREAPCAADADCPLWSSLQEPGFIACR